MGLCFERDADILNRWRAITTSISTAIKKHDVGRGLYKFAMRAADGSFVDARCFYELLGFGNFRKPAWQLFIRCEKLHGEDAQDDDRGKMNRL